MYCATCCRTNCHCSSSSNEKEYNVLSLKGELSQFLSTINESIHEILLREDYTEINTNLDNIESMILGIQKDLNQLETRIDTLEYRLDNPTPDTPE